MTKEEAVARLEEASACIATAVMLLEPHLDLFEQFEAERRRMESVGAILDPTLFNSSERRATEALLAPVFAAATEFVRKVKTQQGRAAAALAQVRR